MIEILVELLIFWLLLWWFDKSNLSVLGFKVTKNRTFHFILGFITVSPFCVFYNTATSTLANTNYTRNPEFTIEQFFKSSWWVLNSVLFEELIFRGALLYIEPNSQALVGKCDYLGFEKGKYNADGIYFNIEKMLENESKALI